MGPFDVAGPFQLVDQGDHRAAVDAKPLADRLLGERSSLPIACCLIPEERHHAEVLDREIERLERPVGDFPRVLGSPAEDGAETTLDGGGEGRKAQIVHFD